MGAAHPTHPTTRASQGQVSDSFEDVAWLLQREQFDDLPVVLRLTVDGEPVSKARARFTGYGSMTFAYTPQKTRDAEEAIARKARTAGIDAARADVTFGLFAKFFCGTWQRRDVDNMVKLVADALNGVVWADDVQISEMSGSVQRGVDDPRTHILVYETRANMPPTKPCRVCAKPVRQYRSQPNNYCSKDCSAEGQRKQVELTCVHCRTVFSLPFARANRIKTPVCSEECRKAMRTVSRPCRTCGVTVSRPKSQTKPKTFCSAECSNAYKVGKPRGGGEA